MEWQMIHIPRGDLLELVQSQVGERMGQELKGQELVETALDRHPVPRDGPSHHR
jgi:hypothetical protein